MTTPRITRKNASAVPSLKRLSHSKIRFNLRGTPISLNMLKAAAVSVDEIRAPKRSETINGISMPIHQKTNLKTTAIKKAERTSETIERALIDLIFRINSEYRI